MMMTEEHTRTFVGYGMTAHRALMEAIASYSDMCDLFEVDPLEISINVHLVADQENSGTFVATAHLSGIEPR
jgi:hypothetical protein